MSFLSSLTRNPILRIRQGLTVIICCGIPLGSLANTCPDAPVTKLRSKISGAGIDDAQAYTQGAFYEMGVCACLSGKLSPKADVAGLKGRSMIAHKNAKEYKPSISLRPWPAQCKRASEASGGAEQDLSVDYAQVMKYTARLQAVTDGFARAIDQVDGLTQTQDPEALLNEFNAKMQNLSNVDQSISNTQINRTARSIEQMADAASNLNETSLYKSIGSAASLYELSEAREKAKAKQAQLEAERRSQMSQFYWRAVDQANAQIEDFANRAAFAEDKKTEDYWMAMVNNLVCYQQSMRQRWRPNSTDWLQNSCPIPPAVQPGMPNNLISAERKAQQLAERKFARYMGSELDGVGLDVDVVNKHGLWQVVVVNVEPLSPADLAGIKRNDTIMGVYGHPNKAVPLDLTSEELKLFSTGERETHLQTIRNMEAVIASQDKAFNTKSIKRLKKKDPAEYERLEQMHQQAISSAEATIRFSREKLEAIDSGQVAPQYSLAITGQKSAELMERYIDSGRVRWLTVVTPPLSSGTDQASMLSPISTQPSTTNTVNLEPRGPAAFRTAAIAFASKAAQLNPTPEKLLTLARYHEEENELFALGYLYSALDQGAVMGEDDLALLKRLETQTTESLKLGLRNEQVERLTPLVERGLHERLSIDGESLLDYSIAIDKPDSVQLVLNAYVNGASDQDRELIVQEAMLQAARQDSARSLQHLFNLGLEADFSLEGKTLEGEARANNSTQVLALLETGAIPSSTSSSGSGAATQQKIEMTPAEIDEWVEKCIPRFKAALAKSGQSFPDEQLKVMCRQQIESAL